MLLGDVPTRELAYALGSDGIVLELGAAKARVISDVTALATSVGTVYADYPLVDPHQFCDATIQVCHVRGIRRLMRPQIEFVADSDSPFIPFPADTHLPLMEWGLNHALAERLSHYLLLHAGTLARGSSGLLLPATPGSGKSTLTAALMMHGYRLLSDEFGVVGLESGELYPMVRPVALKNESIRVIREIAPNAVLGPSFPKTRKGTVAHLAPSRASIDHRDTTAIPRIVAFPKYQEGAPIELERVDPGAAFNKLALNSFNYEYLGPSAFDAVSRLVTRCEFWRVTYGDLADAISAIDSLLTQADARVSA